MIIRKCLVLTATVLVLMGFNLTTTAQEPSRLPDKKVKPMLSRLSDSVNKYRDSLNNGLKKSSINKGSGEENILQYAEDLKVSANRLKDGYDGNRSVSADVEEVFRRAWPLDKFMRENPVVTNADNEWAAVKQNLEALAQAYNVTWRDLTTDAKPSRMTDAEVASALDRIRFDSENCRKNLEKALKNDRTIDRQTRENILKTMKDFANEANRLKGRVGDDDAGAPRVKELLRWGATIDRFMAQYSPDDQVKRDWAGIRRNLTELAKAYKVA
ncbi:MAG: hypothetical protein ACREEM_08630 [Blastocatellia bacterium]